MKLERIFEAYLSEHDEYINYNITKSRIREDLKLDAKQFVVMHLIRLFKKRFKYTDFYWVVKAVVRRKTIDFKNVQDKMENGLLFENQIDNKDDENKSILDTNAAEEYWSEQRCVDIVDYVRQLDKKIRDVKQLGQTFNEWDREFIEVLLELYEYGNLTEINEVALCMGYTEKDKQEFSLKLNIFRNKIKRCINEGMLEKFK